MADTITALQSDEPSDLILIDSQYQDRVEERRSIIENHSSVVIGAIPEGNAIVQELYAYLLQEYLPKRFPTMFHISADGTMFENVITGKSFPLEPPEKPQEALKILGETVEDDIFLLDKTEEGHRAVAFVCCFPSGFDPSTKLGKVLKEIHKPVPSFEKIGSSMERYFSRLEVGKSVKRINVSVYATDAQLVTDSRQWSVTTQPELFNPKGNHVYAGDEVPEDEDVDINNVRVELDRSESLDTDVRQAKVRMEWQTLTRLPKTQGIMFSFKTFLYPVQEIKEEGLGLQFADAIEGLKLGNAPGMWVYKGGIRWGKSVCEYMRS